MEDLLDKIVDSLLLDSKDRESLKVNRGFSDDVIDKMKFKSCGLKASELWQGSAPENIVEGLKQPNILIPYFNAAGKVIHVRPHKYGIKDFPIHIYIPYPYLGSDLTRVVIAESEFKALASCLLGVPAVGLPGIASFSRNRFNELPDTLHALGVKEAVICFDNEVKDNPALESYKDDFTKRYDTPFYAYVMGYLLKKAEFQVTISTLKNEWRKDGKADIDGILARGISSEEYKAIIARGVSPSTYRSGWRLPNPHKSFLERRIEKFFYEGPVTEKFNSYFVKGPKADSKISNFVIKIIHTLYNHDQEAERLCKFVSNYGDSKAIAITPDAMTSKMAFQKFCYQMGDYEFRGDDKQLQAIWKYIFMNQTGRSVIKLQHYGYDEPSKVWFFANGAYCNDKYFPVDSDEIVWVNDIGYKLPTLGEFDAPRLAASEEHISLTEIFNKLSEIFGGNYAKLLLGWTIGNFFMPEILERWKVYPFLFLHGKLASGKSTLANWISAFFGFTQKGFNFHSSSPVGITRLVAQLSMVPAWLEEYRNKDPEIGKKNNFLRGIYDKTTIVKGTKKEDEIKTYTARSTLIISGEEHPMDAALNSRCLMFHIFRDAEDKKKTEEPYMWLQKYRGIFNSIGHQLLIRKSELWSKIEKSIEAYLVGFDEDQIKAGSRNKIHMSIIAGLCDALIGPDSAFDLFVAEAAEEQEEKVRDEQALYVFFEDVFNMYVTGKLKTKIAEKKINGPVEEMHFWFGAAYHDWEIQHKGIRNDVPASKNALMDHLKKEPYFIKTLQSRIGSNSAYCYVMQINHVKFPDSLRLLSDAIENKSMNPGSGFGAQQNVPF